MGKIGGGADQRLRRFPRNQWRGLLATAGAFPSNYSNRNLTTEHPVRLNFAADSSLSFLRSTLNVQLVANRFNFWAYSLGEFSLARFSNLRMGRPALPSECDICHLLAL